MWVSWASSRGPPPGPAPDDRVTGGWSSSALPHLLAPGEALGKARTQEAPSTGQLLGKLSGPGSLGYN